MTIDLLLKKAESLGLSENEKKLLLKINLTYPSCTEDILVGSKERIIQSTAIENCFIIHESGAINRSEPAENESFLGVIFFTGTKLTLEVAVPR